LVTENKIVDIYYNCNVFLQINNDTYWKAYIDTKTYLPRSPAGKAGQIFGNLN